MRESVRRLIGLVLLILVVVALIGSLSFSTLPPADFTLANGSEPQTLDPHLANGQPEGRLAYALFEGLYRKMPLGMAWDEQGRVIQEPPRDESGNTPLGPGPGVAHRHEVSGDQKTYTFHLRQDARWSDDSPLTSKDFVWSWRRLLHPETASQYATHLHYVRGAAAFNRGLVKVGQRVEVELKDRARPAQMFPSGSIRRGRLVEIELVENGQSTMLEEIDLSNELGPDDYILYSVEAATPALLPEKSLPEGAPIVERFVRGPGAPTTESACHWVLPCFETEVGIRAPGEHQLVVELNQPASFFLELVTFYSLSPVQQACIEQHGDPNWTKPGNLVSNGPFALELRRIRDRVRLRRNEHYWNRKIVQLERIDVLSMEKETTALNAYLNGQLDWCTLIPVSLVPQLKDRSDFEVAPQLTTYFYRFNTTKPPFDDARVRNALSLVVDRAQICESITAAGEEPSEGLCPPGMRGYSRAVPPPPAGDLVEISSRNASDPASQQLRALLEENGLESEFPIDEDTAGELKRKIARKWLADAGYGPNGKPMPRVELLYNTADNHRAIAEFIQQQWRNQLDVDVELVNAEWGTYLSRMKQMDFDIVRGGWIGDYQDPQTFLELWTTGNENNHTGWGDASYDKAVLNSVDLDPEERMRVLSAAESQVVAELPFLPIYSYVSRNLVRKDYKGWYPNCEDVHPLHLVYRVDSESQRQASR